MTKHAELFLLIDSLTEKENNTVTKAIKEQPLKIYHSIYHLIVSRPLKSYQELNVELKGKMTKAQLSKCCKFIYQLIIKELEQLNRGFEKQMVNHLILLEYYNIKNRPGMAEHANQLLEKIIDTNQPKDSIGIRYELLLEQFRANLYHKYSSSHNKTIIEELNSVVKSIK